MCVFISNILTTHIFYKQLVLDLKGTVMQIEKTLINDRLRVLKVS